MMKHIEAGAWKIVAGALIFSFGFSLLRSIGHHPAPAPTAAAAKPVTTATTGPGGIYHAEFPRGATHDVREISTAITAPTGTLIPVRAREGGGACIVPSTSVGALREVGGSER